MLVNETLNQIFGMIKSITIGLIISAVGVFIVYVVTARFRSDINISWRDKILILVGLVFVSCMPGLITSNYVLSSKQQIPLLAAGMPIPIAVDVTALVELTPPPTVTPVPSTPTVTPTKTPSPTTTFTPTPSPTRTHTPTFTPSSTPTLVSSSPEPTPTATPRCYEKNGAFWFKKPRFDELFTGTEDIEIELKLNEVYSDYSEYELLYFYPSYDEPLSQNNWENWKSIPDTGKFIPCQYDTETCSKQTIPVRHLFLPPNSGYYWLHLKLIKKDKNYTQPNELFQCAIRINVE